MPGGRDRRGVGVAGRCQVVGRLQIEESPMGDGHLDWKSMAAGRARGRTIECVRSHFLRVTKAGNVDSKDVGKTFFMFNGGISGAGFADQGSKLPVGEP